MKHTAKTYLTLLLTAVVLLSNIPLSTLGDVRTGDSGMDIGTASDCYQDAEEEPQSGTKENIGSSSDAAYEEPGKGSENSTDNRSENKKPEQAAAAKAERLALTVTDVSAEDMFSFNKSTGTISGFSKDFLDSLVPGEDGFCYVDLVIPGEIGGVAVEKIADKAFIAQNYKTYTSLKIRSLDLSNAVHLKAIGEMAFYNHDGKMYSDMQSCTLELLEGLLSIGPSAFQYQTALIGDLHIPNSVTDVGKSAFMGDSGFNGTLKLSEECTKISEQTFNECQFVGTLVIPEKVTLIENNFAFSKNNFDTVILSSNLKEIGNSAFAECEQLKRVKVIGQLDSQINVNLPESLAVLGNRIFKLCTSLSGSAVIPDSVTSIGSEVFIGTNISTVYSPNNNNTKYVPGSLRNDSLTAFVFPTKELYDLNVSSLKTEINKDKCTYPMTVSFVEKDGSIAGTREVLYNRPIGYAKNSETLVWEQENPFTLPPVPGASVGYDSGWTFQEGKNVVIATSPVTGTKLYPSVSLSYFTFEAAEVKKVYDGLPAYLEVKATQPITEVDSSYYLYYFLGKGNGFSDIVYSGRNPIHYAITDVETGYYTVRIQFKKSGVSKLIYYDEFQLHVDIQKASALPAQPIYNSTPEPGTLLSDIPITLPEDAPSGTIQWQNPNQEIILGTETYNWIYTPDNPGNFTTDTILGTAQITGTMVPTVTGITITPKKAEVKKGESIQFQAVVEGENSPSQTVIWSVSGAKSEGTQISSMGLLTVDLAETEDTLMVTATSAADPSVQASAAVTLINLPPDPTPDPTPDPKPDPTPEPKPDPTPDPIPDPEPATYTVTFHSLNGTVILPITGIKSGSTITLPAVQREGYQFDGWFTNETGGSQFTAQTPVTKDLTLYAHWTLIKNQNNNSSAEDEDDEEEDEETIVSNTGQRPSADDKVEASVKEDGKVSATISADVMKDRIEQAVEAAKQAKTSGEPVTVDIQVTSKEANPEALAVSLPLNVMRQVIASQVDNLNIAIDKPDIVLRLNLVCIQEMERQAQSDVQIEARRINAAPFSEEVRNAAGTRPMFDLTAVAVADQKKITNFGLGEVVVSIPYELQPGENAADIGAIYIDPSGKVEYLEQSYYDATAKAVVFRTSHFSVYGIGKRPAAGQTGRGGWPQTYIVRRNDNLWKIAKLFHCSIKELVELNHIKNPDIIITGSQLLIPQP